MSNDRKKAAWRRASTKCKSRRNRLIADIKLEQGCMDCGLVPEFSEVLEFDHREDEDKEFTIGSGMMRHTSLPRLLAEIAKCDVVCANCHRVRTVRRRDRLEL